MVLSTKVQAALERARKAHQAREKDGLSHQAQRRCNEAFNASAEVLFHLLDNDQAA